MNETIMNQKLTDIIDEILFQDDALTKENLSYWIRRYPHFEKELIEFAALEAIERHAPESEADSGGAGFEQNWKIVENLIQKKFSVQGSAPINAESIVSLKEQAETQGLKFPQVARMAGLSLQLLLSLEQRLVKASSIPRKVTERIAEVLKTSAESVTAYLEQPPQLLSGMSYKSASQPELGEQRDFTELVREDMKLTPEEKRRLLETTE